MQLFQLFQVGIILCIPYNLFGCGGFRNLINIIRSIFLINLTLFIEVFLFDEAYIGAITFSSLHFFFLLLIKYIKTNGHFFLTTFLNGSKTILKVNTCTILFILLRSLRQFVVHFLK